MAGLGSDASYNLVAFAVMAVAGVVLNLLLLGIDGDAALGVFNQVYAVYVVTSQLAVFGLHESVHRHVAATSDPVARGAVLAGALPPVVVSGVAMAGILFVAAAPLGRLADSAEVGDSIRWITVGLALYAVNKVLMAALAGQARLKAYAGVQIVRIGVLFGVTAGIALSDAPASTLALGFSAAEVAILPMLWILLRPRLQGGASWTRRHLAFGAKALPHGLIAESFLRVDVLMLAPFADDGAIGIYSLAAMFAEGLYQVGATLRTVIGPRLVPLLLPDADPAARGRLLLQGMGLGLAGIGLVGGGVALGFPALQLALPHATVTQAHGVFLVLALGLGTYAAFLPLDTVLLWAGSPGRQSVLMAFTLTANVALNAWWVPRYGILGAATATALAWGVSAVALQIATWRWLGWRGGVVGAALWRRPR